MFGPSEFGGTCAEQHHSADGAHRRGTERGENRSRWNSNSDEKQVIRIHSTGGTYGNDNNLEAETRHWAASP